MNRQKYNYYPLPLKRIQEIWRAKNPKDELLLIIFAYVWDSSYAEEMSFDLFKERAIDYQINMKFIANVAWGSEKISREIFNSASEENIAQIVKVLNFFCSLLSIGFDAEIINGIANNHQLIARAQKEKEKIKKITQNATTKIQVKVQTLALIYLYSEELDYDLFIYLLFGAIKSTMGIDRYNRTATNYATIVGRAFGYDTEKKIPKGLTPAFGRGVIDGQRYHREKAINDVCDRYSLIKYPGKARGLYFARPGTKKETFIRHVEARKAHFAKKNATSNFDGANEKK